MTFVDKAKVQRAFDRGAREYDQYAIVQRRAAERMLELTLPCCGQPGRILDVGAGTGALLSRLASLFPTAMLAGVDLAANMALAARRRTAAALCVADAEALPFPADSFDLVVSTSTFQWLPRLEQALSEACRVVAPCGTVALALFGGDTLCELRSAWKAALPVAAAERSHVFHSRGEVTTALTQCGLSATLVTSERMTERHRHPFSLLRSLKRIGAGSAVPQGTSPAGLGARAALVRMADLYQVRHGSPAGVPATWEIIYAVTKKPSRPDR